MATADRVAANLNLSAFSKASDLKKRIWFTLGCLLIYRLGTFIPIPGIDQQAFADLFAQQAGGILGYLNVFSGGAVERMTIFALNIMPYISASIIVQLLTAVSPRLEQLRKEGEAGRKKINQYTRYGTVLLAAVQAYAIAIGLEAASSSRGSVVPEPGLFFRATVVITLVGGTVFLMWLGEQITARGVGNGISLIIFAGIVATLPVSIAQMFEQARRGGDFLTPIIFMVFALAVVAAVVYVERAQRRIPVQYPKRQIGSNRTTAGETSFIPLKLNTSGVIPPIFASSLLLLPATFSGFSGQNAPDWVDFINVYLGRGSIAFITIYVAMIVFFAFFYTAIVFNPQDTAENLRKYGGFVPGIRPGTPTADYFDYVLTRITCVGAFYLGLVCALPEVLSARFAVPFYFGGTSLLIAVSVTMDTVSQIQGHLLAHQYEGLIKKQRLKGAKK
jgi:preprotein translocase subunit SecY